MTTTRGTPLLATLMCVTSQDECQFLYTSPMPETARSVVPLKVVSAGATDIGRVRQHNEDAVLVRPDLSLFLVADGAGGHNAGNVASALAATSVGHYFEATANDPRLAKLVDELNLSPAARRLSRAIQMANREIIEIAKTRNNYHGMGTTIAAVSAQPEAGVIHVAHVGDSRVYRVREARIEQLTTDHSLQQDILEQRPDLPDEVSAKLPRKVVTRALGMEEALRVSVRTHQIIPGDKYLICSDGITGALDDDDLSDVLRIVKTPEEGVKLLIDMANEAGAEDNLAAVILMVELTPGVSQFPRRSLTPSAIAIPRPKPRRSPSSPIDASSPEIVIVGVEMVDDDSSAQFHVVPAETSSPNLLSALGNFVGPLRPRPKSTPPPIPSATRPTCARCGKLIENAGLVCPHCGTPRDLTATSKASSSRLPAAKPPPPKSDPAAPFIPSSPPPASARPSGSRPPPIPPSKPPPPKE
jgi:PPM family protein phosphatase